MDGPDPSSTQPEQPAGKGDYVIKPGDCIGSLACERGHLPKTILNDAANQELNQARKDYHILLPGDRITIPPIRQKQVSAATEKRHPFVLKGVVEIFRMRFLDAAEQPRANLPYVLMVGEKTYSGTTDARGELKHNIPANSKKGRLLLGSGDDMEEIDLRMGELDPTGAITGVQARLTNLGFDCGPVDGILGPKTGAAIKRFQRSRHLDQSGKLDDATLRELENLHGS